MSFGFLFIEKLREEHFKIILLSSKNEYIRNFIKWGILA